MSSSSPARFRSASLGSVPPILPSPPPKKESYAPSVSSPLREDGTSEPSDDQLDGVQRRRSLQVTVVPVETEVDARTDSDTESRKASLRSNRSQIPLLRRESPVASLQSVGRDFSRYPTRDFSSETYSTNTTSSIPLAVLTRDPVESGFNIDIEDPERGFSPYLERRGLPVVYPTLGEKEDDDDLHCPDVNENVPLSWKALLKEPRFYWISLIVFLFVGGLLTMFVGWPILTYMREGRSESSGPAELSQHVFPILKAARPLIDPDTPEYALTRKSVLGQGELKLVFSDEFNEDGRTFYENEDQFWQAADLHYASTQDLEWYDPDQITTKNGTLQLQLIARRNHDLDYQSGMLGSWNKLCFKGGIMEVSASLAGPGGTPGLWPGIWTLGNLARPGYRATTDGVWPYSYDNCDAGITPNQSSFDGISFLPGQRLPNCVCRGEDHPNSGVGRGAPEIDALEGTAEYDMKLGLITQSSQVAPFDIWYQTDANFIGLTGEFTQMNSWMGGPFQQAISGVTTLNNSWYDGIAYQKYAFEYIPGKEDGMIAWFVGDDETFRMSGKATGPNGNVGQRDVTQEPMSIILNLGISTSWVWIDWPNIAPRLIEGTTLHIDYVRIYQKEGEELITCDPPGYPTTQYIRDHPEPYNNPNLTMWSQTGYPWPKNQLMDDCE